MADPTPLAQMADKPGMGEKPDLLRWPIASLMLSAACFTLVAIMRPTWWGLAIQAGLSVLPVMALVAWGIKWTRESRRRSALGIQEGDTDG